jgi:hypothetical protein
MRGGPRDHHVAAAAQCGADKQCACADAVAHAQRCPRGAQSSAAPAREPRPRQHGCRWRLSLCNCCTGGCARTAGGAAPDCAASIAFPHGARTPAAASRGRHALPGRACNARNGPRAHLPHFRPLCRTPHSRASSPTPSSPSTLARCLSHAARRCHPRSCSP